jgi:hypothetical protein
MSFSEDPTQGIEHGATAGEDPAGSGAADTTADPTGGAVVGEDPSQGSEVGEGAYEDPTQGDELGAAPGEDPMAPSV